MNQSTIDFLFGLSKSIIQGYAEAQKHAHGGIGNSIVEGIEKSRTKLIYIGISVALIGTGFFLTLWGIATSIDTIFAMRGLGYVMIGLPVVLIGALVYKK